MMRLLTSVQAPPGFDVRSDQVAYMLRWIVTHARRAGVLCHTQLSEPTVGWSAASVTVASLIGIMILMIGFAFGALSW